MSATPVFSLIYKSKATQNFSPDQLFELSNKANARNEELMISGFLQFKNGDFLQYLEGEKTAVMSLMNDITQDNRHEVQSIIYLPELTERFFANWHMRYITPNEFNYLSLTDLLHDLLMQIDKIDQSPEEIENRALRLINRVAIHYNDTS
ncbi:BLUF domain-containing protein [Fulvivirga maritima]|uniref:BLUF domain-containing protein n=1 Tax=Fulvivirga maritima TaxID=2904247 RepID=UPI001F21C58A|nr:BLUF domain-containing protein [Fulvivirga maritima]UII28332.1 BLUF domain-containing protein [Fulvivirga maritima]